MTTSFNTNIVRAAFLSVDSCCLFGIKQRVYNKKVRSNFWLCAKVELGIILLLKLNGTFNAEFWSMVHLCCAQKCLWNCSDTLAYSWNWIYDVVKFRRLLTVWTPSWTTTGLLSWTREKSPSSILPPTCWKTNPPFSTQWLRTQDWQIIRANWIRILKVVFVEINETFEFHSSDNFFCQGGNQKVRNFFSMSKICSFLVLFLNISVFNIVMLFSLYCIFKNK